MGRAATLELEAIRRVKISVANTGAKRPDLSEYNRTHIRRGTDNPFYGKHHAFLSEYNRTHIRKGTDNPFYGKHHTEETRLKMSNGLLGKLAWNSGIPRTEEEKLRISEATVAAMATMPPEIRDLLRTPASEEGRKRISQANSGNGNGNWRGGISFEPYTAEFYEKREKIKDRDNHQCWLCGVPESECLLYLCVHHIDYDKKNDADDNLISLCLNCHAKTNSNREYWQTYLSNLMEGRQSNAVPS